MKGRCCTKESDRYAFGMVVHEIRSGNATFGECLPFFVPGKIFGGERPTRSLGEGGRLFTDGILGVIELCWRHKPGAITGVSP